MTLPGLQKMLRGTTLEDVLIPGFVDERNQPVRFHAMLSVVYFEFAAGLIKFEAIGSAGIMRISSVSAVLDYFELDDDMVAAVTSVREQVLGDPAGRNKVTALRLWHATTQQEGVQCCSSAQIDLANGQQIFLDPTYYFGIRIGGAEQRSIWLENGPDARGCSEEVLRLSDS